MKDWEIAEEMRRDQLWSSTAGGWMPSALKVSSMVLQHLLNAGRLKLGRSWDDGDLDWQTHLFTRGMSGA